MTYFAKEGTYTLAVPTSYTALIGYVKKNYPQFKVRTFPTNEACFQGVKAGKADFMAAKYQYCKFLDAKAKI